jgi:hypothetical protein
MATPGARAKAPQSGIGFSTAMGTAAEGKERQPELTGKMMGSHRTALAGRAAKQANW